LFSPELHVVPLGDLRDHTSTSACWCKPKYNEDGPGIWVHNSMDRREHTAEQGKLQ